MLPRCARKKALQHSYVGTEHILLGLLREGEGVAARVLKSLKSILNAPEMKSSRSSIQTSRPRKRAKVFLPRPEERKIPRHRHYAPSVATSPNLPRRMNSIRSSAGPTRSSVSSRFCAAAPRTTPSSSVKRVLARQPSLKVLPRKSSPARCPNFSVIKRSSPSISH